MKIIHMETVNERVIKNNRETLEPRHYFYLCDGSSRIFLCKQRVYKGVSSFFRMDIPVKALSRHKWGRDKMVDQLMDLLPRRIASAERWEMACAD